MISKIKKKINGFSWKHWLTFLILSQGINIVMVKITFPIIIKEAGGRELFDILHTGYTYEYAYSFLSKLSLKGYKVYKYIQLPLDTLYPFQICFLGICTIVLLKRIFLSIIGKERKGKFEFIFRLLFCLPVLSMLFDYFENLTIITMLMLKTKINRTIVFLANIFTITKSMATILFYISVLVILLLAGVLWMRNKQIRMTRNEKL